MFEKGNKLFKLAKKSKKRRFSKTGLFKAIRNQCLECVSNSALEVELCTFPKCSLYPYRFGNDKGSFHDTHFIQGTNDQYMRNGERWIYVNGKGWQE